MRTLWWLTILVFGLAACRNGPSADVDATRRVGLVLDIGGLGDKSFNDLSHVGLLRAVAQFGVVPSFIEPGDNADREAALRQLAAGPEDPILGIGFLFTDDINQVSVDFPHKTFACIDYALIPGRTVPPNVVAIKFREHEGAFLVGAIAALTSKTGIVGFVGGMDIPLIHKFERGFAAGVEAVRPGTKVLTGYAGVTGEAFRNPARGKAIGLAQIGQGADILFHASGSTGLGVFEAARERGVLAIGVDADQWAEAPGTVLTSMVKKVDVAVFKVIQDHLAGRLKGGVVELGLAEDGVGYVFDDHNRHLIAPETIARVEELKARIIRGDIRVLSTRE